MSLFWTALDKVLINATATEAAFASAWDSVPATSTSANRNNSAFRLEMPEHRPSKAA